VARSSLATQYAWTRYKHPPKSHLLEEMKHQRSQRGTAIFQLVIINHFEMEQIMIVARRLSKSWRRRWCAHPQDSLRCPSRCETKRNYLNCRKFVNEPDTPQAQVPSSAPNGKHNRVSVEATCLQWLRSIFQQPMASKITISGAKVSRSLSFFITLLLLQANCEIMMMTIYFN